jgi:hypothetical protein
VQTVVAGLKPLINFILRKHFFEADEYAGQARVSHHCKCRCADHGGVSQAPRKASAAAFSER